ncbi:hypothetical protein ACU61A_15725 [Pseudonocardia sichuanensis]
MARSTPAALSPTLGGVLATPTEPSVDGDVVPAGSRLLVINGGATAVTVTVDTTATDSGLVLPDAGGAVAAGAARLLGPFPARLFAQPADAAEGANAVLVDYSAVTDVTRVVLA